MWKVIETAIIWACLPFVALGALALLFNATWAGVLIVLGVLASPFIAGALYGLLIYQDDYGEYERAKRGREDADEVHRALLPGRPEDVTLSEPTENMPAQGKAL